MAFLRGPWPVRIGLFLVVAAYCASALFGIACPILWGHHGYHAATYMLRAIMTLRFHVVTPCNWAGYEFPPRFSWYFHHPIGYHHLLWPILWLLGVHEWVARGIAAAGGLVPLFALYAIGKHHWSRPAGLLAATVWVAMPFTMQYAVLLDPMLLTMGITVVALDAFVRYWKELRARWLWLGTGMFVAAGLLMWDGYFEAFFLGLVAMTTLLSREGRRARVLVEDPVTGQLRATRWNAPLAWLFVTGFANAATMAFHFLFTWYVGMMGDFHASYEQRHGAGLGFVWDREEQWFLLLLGRPLLVVAVLWMLVFVGRAVAGHARKRDVAVWIFFVEKTFYILLFREAAAVHEYRVDWYSVFLALAAADLASDAVAFGRMAFSRWPGVARIAGPALGVLFAAALLRYEVPQGYAKLVDSRVTMGTDGVAYNSDYGKQLFAKEVAARTGPEDFVFTLTPGFPRRIEFYYYMDRSNLDVASFAQLQPLLRDHPRALVILDPRGIAPSEHGTLVELLRHHPADVYDGYMVIDLRSDKPGLREFVFEAQPTTALYRYFVSHVYAPMKPRRTSTPITECLTVEAGLPVPEGAPPSAPLAGLTAELAECRHNYLLLRGDRAGADAVREQLRAMLHPTEGTLAIAGKPVAQVVALRLEPRGSLDIWLEFSDGKASLPDGKPSLPDGKPSFPDAPGLRLRLWPVEPSIRLPAGMKPPPPRPPVTLEKRVLRSLAALPSGALTFERLPVGLIAPGRYRATVEVVDYPAAPPPPVPRPSPPRPAPAPAPPWTASRPPPPPAAPRVVASVDLGLVEIR